MPASAAARGDRRVPRARPGRLARALDRPRLWRVTAAIAALLFVAIVAVAAQGSITVIAQPHAAREPEWARWCRRGVARTDRRRLAFCARVDGTVVAVKHGPGAHEVHLAVLGDFHLTIVRLPSGSHAPGVGAWVTAIGPLLRARDGQREVQAFRWVRT